MEQILNYASVFVALILLLCSNSNKHSSAVIEWMKDMLNLVTFVLTFILRTWCYLPNLLSFQIWENHGEIFVTLDRKSQTDKKLVGSDVASHYITGHISIRIWKYSLDCLWKSAMSPPSPNHIWVSTRVPLSTLYPLWYRRGSSECFTSTAGKFFGVLSSRLRRLYSICGLMPGGRMFLIESNLCWSGCLSKLGTYRCWLITSRVVEHGRGGFGFVDFLGMGSTEPLFWELLVIESAIQTWFDATIWALYILGGNVWVFSIDRCCWRPLWERAH